MDSEKPHRKGTSGGSSSELFICFTSRLSSSSSSMKISSKSILSPGRTDKFRDPPASLSSSLSRRLRSNGSIKGGQCSPMFPTGSKKRGCAFENPEPSSPKVTCIGQVRVKTKKQGKKLRTRSKRRGEVSFRKIEQGNDGASNPFQNRSQHQQPQECLPHRNQKWVHLPLTICEALRAFGAEFNCFLPCRSSCSSERGKEEKIPGSGGGADGGSSSCGAVFARWLVSMQDGDGKGREIELVVGDDEREGRSQMRQLMEEIEAKDEKDEILEDEEARMSICVPPKNALLLMRCRSDPMRMSALANRLWESSIARDDEEQEADEDDEGKDEEDEEGNEEEREDVEECEDRGSEEEYSSVEQKEEGVSVSSAVDENHISEVGVSLMVEKEKVEEDEEENLERILEVISELEEGNIAETEEQEQEVDQNSARAENLVDPGVLENKETEENEQQLIQEDHESDSEEEDDAGEQRKTSHASSSPVSVQPEEDQQEDETEEVKAEAEEEEQNEAKTEAIAALKAEAVWEEQEETLMSKEETEPAESSSETHETATPDDGSEQEDKTEATHEDDDPPKSEERERQQIQERESSVLPDCLLLMMYEPKLSMEVSKETWVCSTDFIRWLPDRHVNPKDAGDEPKKRVSIDSNPAQLQSAHLQQPPRSSCSFPAPSAAASMATMIEQKLVNAVAYEPFVLTRCKSEPMRSSAKFAPEACFWKNRKLEAHRQATFGVGAAGVGF